MKKFKKMNAQKYLAFLRDEESLPRTPGTINPYSTLSLMVNPSATLHYAQTYAVMTVLEKLSPDDPNFDAQLLALATFINSCK